MFIRPKKLQLELERYSAIQRNNRFLLERLATIRREGAWIDNKNYHDIKSLNTWKRQQEMISLAYNNQIMLARLQDVGAGLNRHKLEDEYLMNQKHKANILKYPPNWREIQEHMVKLKKETFKKVFDSKYQRKEYEKSRKKVLKHWATEREKHEAAKAEKLAKTSAPDERQEALMKKENGDAANGKKKTLEGALKKYSKPETGRDEKSKFDQRKQKTEIMKKPSINGKVEAQRKMTSTQRKKPPREKERGSTSKTNNVANKEESESKPNKARPAFSTGFDFKGDSKSMKEEISPVGKHIGSNENSQDSETVLKEENVPFRLNKKISDGGIENVDSSTTSGISKQSKSDGVLSTISESSKPSEEYEESGNEKDFDSAASQDEGEASDSFEDETETELSDLSDEKTDYETENSVFPNTSDSDKNFECEKENKKNSDESSYDTSDETSNSKEEDDES